MSDLDLIVELQKKIGDLQIENNLQFNRILDLEGRQAKQPTMYEVTFESKREDVVLNLPFIPQKGNVFEFFSPLISSAYNETDDYFLEVKSIHFDIDKEGKLSKIKAWCECY